MHRVNHVVHVVVGQCNHGDTTILGHIDSMLFLELLNLLLSHSTITEHADLIMNE